MARTADQLTASEEVMIGELENIDNSKILYKDGSGNYIGLGVGTNLAISGGNLNASGGSGSGDVTGPASAVNNNFASFDTTTGKLIKDSGYNANSFLTSLSGAVLIDQTVGQTIGDTTNRLTKLWATDITVTNAINGSITGNAGTVTNATLTTALTVNTGTVTLIGNVANTSALTIGAGAVSVSGSNTGDQDLSGLMVKTNNLSDVLNQQTALNNITAVSGATNEYVLTKDTATGNALWKAAAGGGLSWGASITSTSGTGITTTIGNSASAGTIGQSIVAGNTQTNAVTLLSLDTGTGGATNSGLVITCLRGSGAGGGLLINEFGSATQAIASTYGFKIGTNFNTNSSSIIRNISVTNENNAGAGSNSGIFVTNNSTKWATSGVGSGVIISQVGVGGTALSVIGGTSINTSTNGLVNFTLGNTQSGATVMCKSDTGTSAQGQVAHQIKLFNTSTSARGIEIDISSTGTGIPIELITSGTARTALKFSTGFTSTTATSGAVAATPANVDGFIIIDVGGTTKKIAYYLN